MVQGFDKNQQVLDRLVGFEFRLQKSLHPIQPDPEFVSHLRGRLSASPTITLDTRSSRKLFVIVASGLFWGVLLIWLIKQLR